MGGPSASLGGAVAQTTRYVFGPDDQEGIDFRQLADQTATTTVLEGCPALLALPLVQDLAPNDSQQAAARILQKLLYCTLDLAFAAHQKTPDNVEAADTIAAGAIMGLVSTSPGQIRPEAGKFIVVVKGRKEARQNLATQWAGSNRTNNARGTRDYEVVYLSTFRQYLHTSIENGELRSRYIDAYRPATVAAPEAETPVSGDEVPPPDEVVIQAVPSAQPEPKGLESKVEPRHRRWIWGPCIAALVGALAAGVFLAWPESAAPKIGVVVDTNRDHLVLDPAKFPPIGGSYVTNQPIERVPPPPQLQDSCDGRWAWAHSPTLQSVDADFSIARVDLTPLSHAATIVGAQVHYDNNQTPAIKGTYLTCPGRGGNLPPNTIDVDLDSGKVAFYPGGSDQPATLNLQIAKGATETLIVEGDTIDRFYRWRLELAINDGHSIRALTIGSSGYAFGTAASHPEVKPFETTGSINGSPYRFKNGEWKAGR